MTSKMLRIAFCRAGPGMDKFSPPIQKRFLQESIVHVEVFCYNKEKMIIMDVYML